MKKALLTVATLAALLVLTPLTALGDDGFYVGGSVGSASLSEDFDGFNVDSDSTAFRLVAGWQINDYLSVEGGYQNFGAFEQTFTVNGEPVDVSLDADGFMLGGTGSFPLSDRFALYGRVGAFFWDGDAEINNVSQARPEDTNLYLGAGVSFALTGQLKLIVDWTRYNLEDTESNVISLGLTYGF
jgi:OOP family OmpA-OmpF porin